MAKPSRKSRKLAPKKKAGRPPHKPTDKSRNTVKAMASYGILQEDIGTVVGVSKPTLEKHYRRELDTGAIKANSKVAESLYKQATSGNVTAAIWWTKARMRWKEESIHRLEGEVEVTLRNVLDEIDGHTRGLPKGG